MAVAGWMRIPEKKKKRKFREFFLVYFSFLLKSSALFWLFQTLGSVNHMALCGLHQPHITISLTPQIPNTRAQSIARCMKKAMSE